MDGPASVSFGGHCLDLAARQLFRGREVIHLSPKAFDLLQFLIHHRTRALSKEELHTELWPGTFVTEATLASLVAEVRRALEDEPRTPRFVRTVHRFGYAFCGQVDAASPPPAAAAAEQLAWTSWIVWRGREYPLKPGDNVIGRDPTATVRLDFPSVSRRHARLVVSESAVTVEDLGSKNGTILRNVAVVGAAELADFDELQIGSATLIVRILRDSAPTQSMNR